MLDDVYSKTPLKSAIFGTYSYYMERLKSYKKIKSREQKRIVENSLRTVGEMLGKKLFRICNVFTERACVWCFLLQTIFFVQKLDHDIDWKWTNVFIPSYIIFILFLPASFLSMIFTLVSGKHSIIKFYYDNAFAPVVFSYVLGLGIAKGVDSNKYSRIASVLLFLTHASLFVFTLLMALKLEGSLDMEWSVIFVFVYPFLLIQTLLVVPMMNRRNIGTLEVMAIGGFTTFMTLMLFGLYLDEKIICSAQLIFIPAYVIAGLTFFGVFSFKINEDEEIRHTIRVGVAAGCAILVSFLGPLGKTLDGINDKKFATCYIGIFLFEAILIPAHLFGSFVSWVFHIDDE